MNTILKLLLIIQVALSIMTIAASTKNTSILDDRRPTNTTPVVAANEDNNDKQDDLPDRLQEMKERVEDHGKRHETIDNNEKSAKRREDHHAAFRKRAKPLKNIVLGIYRNYKSTYLGNRTTLEYKKRLRDNKNQNSDGSRLELEIDALASTTTTNPQNAEMEFNDIHYENEYGKDIESVTENMSVGHSTSGNFSLPTTAPSNAIVVTEMATERIQNIKDINSALTLKQKFRKRKRKHDDREKIAKKQKRFKVKPPGGGDDPLTYMRGHEYIYKVGPGFNMTLDMENDVVSVHLDAINLQQLMHGRWLSDNTEEGRGKKYDMVTKVLPLFVLPFLIQSAIVPFLVTKLKLLLMKSILVGKLAIFLLIISAIKNNNKSMQTYEVAPSYWAGEPSRRSELVAASSAAYNGYRVEGKPTAWIN